MPSSVEIMKSSSEILKVAGQNKLGFRNSVRTPDFLRSALTNPLELKEIVDKVCSYLDYASLASVRQINCQWHESASSQFRKLSRVVFETSERSDETEIMNMFCDHFQHDRSFVSLKLILHPSPLPELSKRLLEVSGSNLTSLSISALHLRNTVGFSELVVVLVDTALVNWCPNLLNLELSHIADLNFVVCPNSSYSRTTTLHRNLRSFKFSLGTNVITNQNRLFISNLFTRILDKVPTLESVDLSVPSHSEFMNLALYALYQRVHEKSWPTLKSLRLNSIQMSSTSIEVLNHTCYANLKYLRLSSSLVRKPCLKSLEAFVAEISHHLETLIFDKFDDDDESDGAAGFIESQSYQRLRRPIASFQFFKTMIALHTYENNVFELFHDEDAATFIEKMPNLKTLVLKSCHELHSSAASQFAMSHNLWDALLKSTKTSSVNYYNWTLQKLVVKEAIYPTDLNLHAFDRFVLQFRNLRILETAFNASHVGDGKPLANFLEILTQLRNLEELSLEILDISGSQNEQSFWESSFQQILATCLPKMSGLKKITIDLNGVGLPTSSFPLTFNFFKSSFCGLHKNLTSVNLNGFQVRKMLRTCILCHSTNCRKESIHI